MKYARVGLALAGFAAALLSVALDNKQIAWGAIALLTGSLILRLVSHKREDRSSGHDGV
jgi:hypothetical protein